MPSRLNCGFNNGSLLASKGVKADGQASPGEQSVQRLLPP